MSLGCTTRRRGFASGELDPSLRSAFACVAARLRFALLRRSLASFANRGSLRSQRWLWKKRITDASLRIVCDMLGERGTGVRGRAGVGDERRRTENEGAQARDQGFQD